MIKKILILSFLFAFIPSFAGAMPAKDGQLIKAGISDNGFSNFYYKQIETSATEGFDVTDKATGQIIGEYPANTVLTVILKDGLFDVYVSGKETAAKLKGPVVMNSEKGFLYIPNLKRANKQAIYRGVFEFTKSPTKENTFSVVNVLDIESYLRGVVPNEMPVSFGLEALKAQAVAARNYVLKPREKNYHNFDVGDSVASQVYFGAGTEQDLSDKAIVETEDIVAMYNGELILALYSSTAGGHSENYENVFADCNSKNFNTAAIPYLKGVPDNNNVPRLETEGDVKNFYLSTPTTFDNKSPYFRWTREWTPEELEEVLQKTLKSCSNTCYVRPSFNEGDKIGKIQDIRVLRRGVSGKIMVMEIITNKGSDKNAYVLQKELIIRQIFKKDNKNLPSANVVFDFERDEKDNLKKITAIGGGFGHGVGMSQFGAGMMGAMGYSYDEILKHYYSGIEITTNPVVLSTELNQDTASISFYTRKKKTTLVVENKFHFSDLIMVINSKELRFSMSPQPFKPYRFDISSHVKQGKNNVVLVLPQKDNFKKSVRLYLELNGTGK